jgi:transposase-like protein
LTFDGTFFGRGYGFLIYRAEGRNIHWQEIVSERIQDMEAGLLHLKQQGWKFSSVTIDGRKGAISLVNRLFPNTPVQLCLFHQKAVVRRYLTGNPKTDCGKEIAKLSCDLLTLTEEEFLTRLQTIRDTYAEFLKERNEMNQFKHRRLRSALRSLRSNAPYLFAYKRFPERKIPHTTNSCDGSFAHWKNKVKIHRGLKRDRRAKMINFLLSNS